MNESASHPIQRLLVAIGAALLLLSVICNLAFVWRNVSLHRELISSMARFQELTRTQQSITAIAQDLVNLAPQYPWLAPILQKYGLMPPTAPAGSTAASSNPANRR